ncbi:hypothetical protein MRX96_030972 [Rhipicephalus microplus]
MPAYACLKPKTRTLTGCQSDVSRVTSLRGVLTRMLRERESLYVQPSCLQRDEEQQAPAFWSHENCLR